MAYLIPGETPRQAALRQRVERSNKARIEQEKGRQDQVAAAIARRKLEEETVQWKQRMLFEMHLTAMQMLTRLEEIRDEHRPTDPDEPWDSEFCDAVRLIPEARRFAEECYMNCTEEKKG